MTATSGFRSSYDAIIVGARCAGSATAMLLARQGLDVLAIDRGRYGSDTLSTHALMRGGVIQLHRWGVLEPLKAAGTPAVRTTSFHYGNEVIDVQIKSRDGVDALYAPRRSVLDALLVDAAREAGAEVRHRIKLIDLTRSDDGSVNGVVVEDASGRTTRIAAGIVIGADGRGSAVARLVGAERYRQGRHASGVVYGYWSGLPSEGYHWYYEPGVGAGSIPTNDGLTCVFASVPQRQFRNEIRCDVEGRYRRLLEQCAPELADGLADAKQVGKLFAFAGEAGFLRQCQGPGWALVGDAGYFKDPITAHGMTDALRDAELLARAVAIGPDALADYQSARDDLSLGFFHGTDEVASYEWDLPTVKQLHLDLNKEMRREVAILTGLDGELRRSA